MILKSKKENLQPYIRLKNIEIKTKQKTNNNLWVLEIGLVFVNTHSSTHVSLIA